MNNGEILYPESNFGGFTDVDGMVVFWRSTCCFFGIMRITRNKLLGVFIKILYTSEIK